MHCTHVARVKAVEGRPGQPAIDPLILLSLWLLATLDGIRSDRELDHLTRLHIAYERLCGEHAELLRALLTESVATLLRHGLVEPDEVAHDGVRLRVKAFRREKSLQECLKLAKQQVAALQTRTDEDDGAHLDRIIHRKERRREPCPANDSTLSSAV